jgi:hypothetical protein
LILLKQKAIVPFAGFDQPKPSRDAKGRVQGNLVNSPGEDLLLNQTIGSKLDDIGEAAGR